MARPGLMMLFLLASAACGGKPNYGQTCTNDLQCTGGLQCLKTGCGAGPSECTASCPDGVHGCVPLDPNPDFFVVCETTCSFADGGPQSYCRLDPR